MEWTQIEIARLRQMAAADCGTTQMARELGRSRSTVYEKLKYLGIKFKRQALNGAGFDWTDARVERLKAARVEGLSAREVAEEFGDGCTRNAVIGKWNRLGIASPTKSSRARAANRRKHASVPPREPTGNEVYIWQLERDHCRWIPGEPGPKAVYCGTARAPGSSYCPYHDSRAFTNSLPRPAFVGPKRGALRFGIGAVG